MMLLAPSWKKLKGVDFFIIDEISLVDPNLLGKISVRLNQLMNLEGKLFGGKNIIISL